MKSQQGGGPNAVGWIPGRRGWWGASALCVIALAVAVVWAVQSTYISMGFFAKQLCSGVFVSGRDAQDVVDSDLKSYTPGFFFRHIDWTVDRAIGIVRVSGLAGMRREAHDRGAQGCGLVYPGTESEAVEMARNDPRVQARVDPGRAAVTAGATSTVRHSGAFRSVASRAGHLASLQAAMDEAFSEPDPRTLRGTRAVVVMHNGSIIAERYAAGFDRNTRLPGWSLSKSVMNAMVGILAQQGRLHLADRVPVAAWQSAGDARAALTFDNLLRMSSGLHFDENYDNPFSDVTKMLFSTANTSAFAESRPLIAPPGAVWSYASGSTSVLAHALHAYALPGLTYTDMPRQLLFEPLGMASAMIETDASGNLEVSASVYASARDWARFGGLYASDGIWNSVRLLPAGWVEYSSTPTAADRSGRYGAHFWIYDAADRLHARRSGGAELPRDAFYAEGFGGQRITIIPSRDLVIVRLGNTPDARGFDNTVFAARILGALDLRTRTQQVRTNSAHNPG